MFPTLIEFPESIPLIGGRALHTYGALVAIAFLVGILWVRFEAKRMGLDKERVMDLFFYIVLAAIIGSRLLYVVNSVPNWWSKPAVFFKFWEGGLVFYGGLIASVGVSIWYTRRHRIPFFSVADVFAPAIALGHSIGRLGCFAAGCCYGRPVPPDSTLGVLFPKTTYSIAPYDHPVYPVQLFEAAGEFIIFLILATFRRHKKFEGEVFLFYIILYPILRAVLETFRDNEVRGLLVGGWISSSQLISFIWIILAVTLWFTVLRKKEAKGG